MTPINLDTTTLTALGIIGVLAVLGLVAWAMQRRHQSHRLRQRFGAEYARTIDHMGSRDKAEAELLARERRVERLHIVALAPADAAYFAHEWKVLQSHFVDNPSRTLAEADQLVRELMLRRGYPMGDFERRAADISVDHPDVVNHYRAARDIALRDQRGPTDTEDLRKALVHCRALFDELLEVAPAAPQATQNPYTSRHMEARP
jgi:hypothetical protein